jgi:uncharacterized membrane protein AbrB (regulator of aidB expression)
MKAFLSFFFAFSASSLLYALTHKTGVPELARYGIGALLIVGVVYFLWGDTRQAERVFIAATVVGLGVATNRMKMELEK